MQLCLPSCFPVRMFSSSCLDNTVSRTYMYKIDLGSVMAVKHLILLICDFSAVWFGSNRSRMRFWITRPIFSFLQSLPVVLGLYRVARNAAFALGMIQDVYHVHKGHVCWPDQASSQGQCDIVVQLHSNLLRPRGAGIRIWNTSLLK